MLNIEKNTTMKTRHNARKQDNESRRHSGHGYREIKHADRNVTSRVERDDYRSDKFYERNTKESFGRSRNRGRHDGYERYSRKATDFNRRCKEGAPIRNSWKEQLEIETENNLSVGPLETEAFTQPYKPIIKDRQKIEIKVNDPRNQKSVLRKMYEAEGLESKVIFDGKDQLRLEQLQSHGNLFKFSENFQSGRSPSMEDKPSTSKVNEVRNQVRSL